MEGGTQRYLILGLRSTRDQTTYQGEFYRHITATHEYFITRLLKTWSKMRQELAKANAHNIFLLKCRSHDVFPNNILNAVKRQNCISFYSKCCAVQFNNYKNILRLRYLKLQIKDINIHIYYLHKHLNKLKSKISKSPVKHTQLETFFHLTEKTSFRIYSN